MVTKPTHSQSAANEWGTRRGTGSDTLAETDLAGNQKEEYLYFNNHLISRRDVSSGRVAQAFLNRLNSEA
jgi:hypothetical protein